VNRIVLSLVFVLAFEHAAFADFSGRVVGVTDGDTITILHNGQGEKIRLSGIDCPEKAQAYGQKAKQAASGLVFGKEGRKMVAGTIVRIKRSK
jgi:endonuclease YncB( thermonuclease family)